MQLSCHIRAKCGKNAEVDIKLEIPGRVGPDVGPFWGPEINFLIAPLIGLRKRRSVSKPVCDYWFLLIFNS
jgi:hypothetical protein